MPRVTEAWLHKSDCLETDVREALLPSPGTEHQARRARGTTSESSGSSGKFQWEVNTDPGLQGTRTLCVRGRLRQRLSVQVRIFFAELLSPQYPAPVAHLKAFVDFVPQFQNLLGSSLNI